MLSLAILLSGQYVDYTHHLITCYEMLLYLIPLL